MQLIYVTLTEKCNANCGYCYCPQLDAINIEYSDSQIDQLAKIFKLIEKINSTIFLGGGEPGIINAFELDKIFNILNTCWVATNGMFVESYYEHYKSKISKIIYHVLTPDIDIFPTPINEYVYIIHKNNIRTIPTILKRFDNNIQLKLYNSRNLDNDKYLLNTEDMSYILDYCLSVNYNSPFIKQLQSYILIDKSLKMLDICRYKILPTPALHLPTNKIVPCCRAEHLITDMHPDITYNSFINSVYLDSPDNSYDINILDDIPCDGCNRLISNDTIYDNDSVKTHIRQKLKVSKLVREGT